MEFLTPDPAIPDIKVVVPKKHGDARGFFSETYTRRALTAGGIGVEFVQDNHAFSATKGTVRGLHFQTPPMAQAKLVRVVRGAILDVAVDIRTGSPTYGKHVAVELSAERWNQIFIPEGFAHGLVTLTPDVEVLYKVSQYYSAAHDKGLLWNDPALDIPWPVTAGEALLSDKDKIQPRLAALPAYFHFNAVPA
ncbi:MAG: dTDP-4-dehydrorhamnose 3,5-epimerase [Rhodospirillaceae bacterium]|nr:dTDP-4-dehydrorhamnose 3,5-epimerase [Rhodospirillaceae bacterium]